MKSKKAGSALIQKYQNINQKFKAINFNKLAEKSDFKRRKERKLSGKNLILGFMIMALQGRNTFEQWAQEIGISIEKNISKQAVCKRITGCFVAFVLAVLNQVFSQHVKQTSKKIKTTGKLKSYQYIMVQDSTIICLPQWLNKFYPGNYSRGEIKSLIRIQLTIELRSNKIVYFQLTSYSKNDQSMSSTIFSVAKRGDLVIRDLGYFSLGVFEDMVERGVLFVSRIKPGVSIFDIKTGREIKLVEILRKEKKMDRWVLVGNKSKLPLRIVATKLPDEIGNEKIRKEKHNRNKRLNHSQDYYELMRYNIYLTTEKYSALNSQDVARVYGLRWRIENIFKTWKSNLHLQSLIPGNIKMSKARAESILYLMLIFILQFQMKIYNEIISILKQRNKELEISLTKFSQFIVCRIQEIFEMNLSAIADLVAYYCKYDSRKDRMNFIQKLNLS